MNHPYSLSGKRILVTGASGGLGRAIATLAAQMGAVVVVHGRNAEKCQETLRSLAGSGHSMAVCDLLGGDLSGWMKSLAGDGGPLHGLVHAAGIQIVRPLRVLDERVLNETMASNVTTALMLTKAFRQRDVCAGGGSVVWLSSVMALTGQPGQAAYSASKGALVSMCRSLALELSAERIRINCLAPGLVDAGMGGRLRDCLPPDRFDAAAAMHPLGLGKPEHVAGPAVFLLSDAAAWITGTTLTVDGGYCAH